MGGTEPVPEAMPHASVWDQSTAHFERWRLGDTGALDDLVRVLSPVLWHVTRAYGLDQDRAEDVVQTTWLTLVRRHESINEPRAIASWLTTTARREAWRTSKTDEKAPPASDDLFERRMPEQDSAESEVVSRDEQDRLWACVRQLSARCQRLLRVVAFEDRPDYAGIASDLGMPVGSIGPTRGRCLAKLKEALQTVHSGEVDHG